MIVAAVARPQIPPRVGNFTFNLRTGSMPANYRDSEYLIWLNDVKRFIERIITSNRTLDCDVYFSSLDMGILAQAGPGDGSWNPITVLSSIDTYTDKTARPNRSSMTFNTNYYKQPPVTETDRGWKRQFFGTALHEAFHALGLGSLWNGDFRVLAHIPNPIPSMGGGINVPLALATNFGFPLGFEYNMIGEGNPDNPRYTGTYARQEYRNQMVGQSGAANIPIENWGMSWNTTMANAGGTALAHWRGSYYGTPSGIVNTKGQDRIDEVFTSWSSRDEGARRWVGRFTVGALRDIGYSVDYGPLAVALHDWKSV